MKAKCETGRTSDQVAAMPLVLTAGFLRVTTRAQRLTPHSVTQHVGTEFEMDRKYATATTSRLQAAVRWASIQEC